MIGNMDEDLDHVSKYFNSVVTKQCKLIWDDIWTATTPTLYLPLNDTWNYEISSIYETMIMETELFRSIS